MVNSNGPWPDREAVALSGGEDDRPIRQGRDIVDEGIRAQPPHPRLKGSARPAMVDDRDSGSTVAQLGCERPNH
jgi:hypothetical protein